MIDLARPKELRVFNKQICSSANYVETAPCTLLGIIPVSARPFGQAVSHRFESPVFKKLVNGCITELSLQSMDKTGTVLNSHGLPIIIELLVK